MKRLIRYFTKGELALWGISTVLMIASFFAFDRCNYLRLIASLIGVTSLITGAKGNPVGPGLMILFSILYGMISYTFRYYGEMITYLGMTAPMSVLALVTWIRNPFGKNRSEVAVNRISAREVLFMVMLTGFVTVVFYFILEAFSTANLLPSTLSVSTSFLAVYLTFRRSPWFALAYAANDVILIILWTLAAMENLTYISVLVCFVVFLFNDLYGFFNWKRMEKRQAQTN